MYYKAALIRTSVQLGPHVCLICTISARWGSVCSATTACSLVNLQDIHKASISLSLRFLTVVVLVVYCTSACISPEKPSPAWKRQKHVLAPVQQPIAHSPSPPTSYPWSHWHMLYSSASDIELQYAGAAKPVRQIFTMTFVHCKRKSRASKTQSVLKRSKAKATWTLLCT
jgi:choline-glycine betaine transporter